MNSEPICITIQAQNVVYTFVYNSALTKSCTLELTDAYGTTEFLSNMVEIRVQEVMAKVVKTFFIASMLMWIAPVVILYGFNRNLFPGKLSLVIATSDGHAMGIELIV
ncbi:hypothetical protein M9H77_17144 [Catharanthus roseus]|uniref:Uncharacterized protein n=1 Tax=Catharanthus roseus TaxID=4058 RepID=A0ACC0B3Q5_CATRO|nr:hypothetical protein M9H77_17144 [Catharanthus roseus]